MLNIDKNVFFREATLQICSNLDIEIALFNCFKYLKEFIPVEQIYLQIYESGYTAMRTIASVDEKGGDILPVIG